MTARTRLIIALSAVLALAAGGAAGALWAAGGDDRADGRGGAGGAPRVAVIPAPTSLRERGPGYELTGCSRRRSPRGRRS
ncbi:hypothetical protein [Streptomyces sp. NPDC060194]|uniref:hypothetical protein n=1 Tax=Streptomyces sp. NPDC060194 TaxID=3347069 RepID=UPI00365972AB